MIKEKRIKLENESKFDVKSHPYVLAYPYVDTPANVRAGVWQFMLDHASFTREGKLKVFFLIESKDDLWKRVDARIKGEYKRIDIGPMESHLKSGYGKQIALQIYNASKKGEHSLRSAQISESNAVAVQRIENSGSIMDKFLLWCYRKIRNHLFPRKKPTLK